MNKKEIKYVQDVIKTEGFNYGFNEYTDFVDTVKDEKFHELRITYENARNALRDYLIQQGVEIEQ